MSQSFITYREENETGLLCYYIVQKAHPHYCAIVSVGPLTDRLSSVPVGGYNLYVNFNYCLRGHYVPSYNDVMDEISAVMWQMSNWFLINRVLTDQRRYSKFKILTDVASG